MRTTASGFRLTLLGCCFAAVLGCDKGRPTVDAANAYPPDDPLAEGQYRFLYDSWGTEQLNDWPPADFMQDLMKSEPDVFGNQYEKFGFIPDPNDDFPIGFKRGLVDSTRVKETCALCHVARLPDGRLWFGAPNTRIDIGRFQIEVSKRWVAAGHPAFITDLEQKKQSQLGPGRFNAESSDYPMVVPADFPPYFFLDKRRHMNYLGTGRNVRTEIYFAIFTFGAGSPNEQTAKVPFPDTTRVNAFISFLGSLASPPPPPQDAALVKKGHDVFDKASCSSCHHVGQLDLDPITTIDKKPAGQDRLPGVDPNYPRGSISTDGLHRVLVDGDGSNPGTGMDQGRDDLLKFIEKNMLSVTGTDGYRVLDLRGVWVTPPYLHNGSVPTLEDLLRPQAQRPVMWQNGNFTMDTSQPGNQNVGHEFGVDLSDDDKTALVAYLKSL